MRIQQNSLADATTAETDLNAIYVDKGIDAIRVAVKGQIDRYFVAVIPKPRQAEFEAATTIVQNKFAEISANATNVKYAATTYELAWEAEYLIMFP